MGEALFQTHENLEHLAMIERVLGSLPQHMIMGAEFSSVGMYAKDWVLWEKQLLEVLSGNVDYLTSIQAIYLCYDELLITASITRFDFSKLTLGLV
ncbi:hypothetical protein L1987_02216 [Smallanthus sonchifolius]|uniref:Uncharacterized protein n=1 Tax=Smallanthus sonchifolius TaxID=185202 RepID=A0ACB9K765_9ASTR|nr:hypothetical protein L1987_02216 [Smallanthus sonchifolius]